MNMSLFSICISGMLTVFFILGFLAACMRLLLVIFPEKADGTSAAMIAAITSAYSQVFPGTQITKIEEVTRR